MQETGETRDAILEDDNDKLQKIIDANKNRQEIYWIVLFAKPAKVSVDGCPTLIKHMKAYSTKPMSQVGAVIGTVDNKKGTIDWEVNMPQRPFDFDALRALGAEAANDVVVETTSIPGAYVTQ